MCSNEDKVRHLVLVATGATTGEDVLENSSADGGIILDEDEQKLIDIAVKLEEEIIPIYYQRDTVRFLTDFMQVLQNAVEDGTDDIIDDIEFWIDSIISTGKIMVA